jgi:hypothetical protein
VWKSTDSDSSQGRKAFMGHNKEAFDSELYAIWLGLM